MLSSLRSQPANPGLFPLAIPVGPPDTVKQLGKEADRNGLPEHPAPLLGRGRFLHRL